MKIAVIGSREFENYDFLQEKLDLLSKDFKITEIVSGGAKGTDSLAERYAKERNIPMKIFKPDWKFGRRAGPLRNREIVKYSQVVVAFWDGKSRGTENIINLSKNYQKTVRVFKI